MSPRSKQASMAKVPANDRVTKRTQSQYSPRTAPGKRSISSIPLTSEGSEYILRSRSGTLQSDNSPIWNGTFADHFSSHADSHFDSLHMDTMNVSDNSFMMPVMTGSHCYAAPLFDQFTQGPMSQTLSGPLLDSSYPDVMLGDNVLHTSPLSTTMEYPGYGQTSQHMWRHGNLTPPAEIFNPDLSEFSMDPACEISFQPLPESALPGTLAYEKIASRSVGDWLSSSNTDRLCSNSRPGQPRPLRSASERNTLHQTTMAPQDIHYRSDRADKVKARNDPRYDASPDKDGNYHCPMLGEGSCNHRPTKQKCIYAKYLDSHLKPYVCTHGEKGSECDGARFSSNACLFRHEREAHGMHNHGLNPYVCEFPECERSRDGNGFPRRWNQRDHMKRVHDYDPEAHGRNQDRDGLHESNKRRKSGHSHAVQMKRTSSSQAKAQAATYAHGSRYNSNMSRINAHAEKHLHATMMAYPVLYDDVQFSQAPVYQQQSRTSEAYPGSYLVAY